MNLLFFIIPIAFLLFCAWIRFQPEFKWTTPVAALAVVLIGSVFGREFFAIEGGPIPITFDRVLLVGLVGVFVISLLKGTESLRPFNLVDVLILVWITVITYSTVTHDWKYLNNMPASRLLFFNLMPIAVYWLARNSKAGIGDLKMISVTVAAFGIYLSLTAFAEVKELTGLVYPQYIMTSTNVEFLGRGRGPFINPVSNGMFMVAAFCCLLMWWPSVNPKSYNARAAISRRRFGIVLLVGLLAIGVYFTMTRSVWLGLILAGSLFVWLPASRQLKGAMVIAATVICIVAFPVISKNIFSFKRDKDVTQSEMEMSAQMRPMFALVAWKMFQDRPLFGVGFGQYAKTKHPYLRDPHTGKPLSITKSLMQHNVFLAYLTETGLIGALLLTAMLLGMLKISWDIWRDQKLNRWASRFGLLSIVMLANYTLNGMFHDVSIIPQGHMLMFFLIGIANNIHSNRTAFAPEQVEQVTQSPAESYSMPAFQTPKYVGS